MSLLQGLLALKERFDHFLNSSFNNDMLFEQVISSVGREVITSHVPWLLLGRWRISVSSSPPLIQPRPLHFLPFSFTLPVPKHFSHHIFWKQSSQKLVKLVYFNTNLGLVDRGLFHFQELFFNPRLVIRGIRKLIVDLTLIGG